MLVPAFHSEKETDGNAYHICSECISGKNILKENKKDGKGEKEPCKMCGGLIIDGKC